MTSHNTGQAKELHVPQDTHSGGGGHPQIENNLRLKLEKRGQKTPGDQHIESLRDLTKEINTLESEYGFDPRQLQLLYPGVGRVGTDRFKHEPGGSIYSLVNKECYNEDITGTIKAFERAVSGDQPVPAAITAEKPSEDTTQNNGPSNSDACDNSFVLVDGTDLHAPGSK